MTDTKQYTKREVIEAQRRAVRATWARVLNGEQGFRPIATLDELLSMFPLPKVTRPREIVDGSGDTWRIKDGKLQCSLKGSDFWSDYAGSWLTPAFVAALSDLYANPTETVDAE